MRTFRNLFSKKEAGELESKQTDQLGSLILFDSTTDDGGVDIVFVHGLRGTSLGTWSKDGVCWPRDLLNEDINNASLKARAITWGYDASIANVLTYASKESIFGHAETLLGDLSRLRVDNPRPIIFLGHSLGGLVIKEALIKSAAYQSHSRHPTLGKIYMQTKGVIFLGTPHRGSNKESLGDVIAKVARYSFRQPNDQLLQTLRHDSHILENQREQFTTISKDMQVVCIREELPMAVGMVVPEASASYDGFNVMRDSINANHMDMVKFRRRDDIRYQRVLGHILRLVRDVVELKEEEELTNEDNRCLADLLLSDPRDDRIRIEQTKGGLLRDSFCWILDNSEFKEWLHNGQSRLLWIKGDPGKGKTMLMIGILNELSRQRGRPEQSTTTGILSYFLCQETDSRLNNGTAIMRGLVYLLIIQQPSLISHLRQKYDHAGRKLFEDSGAYYSLSGIFQCMLQDPRLTTAYLAVDALDECAVGLPEILDLINRTISEQSTRVKWIVSLSLELNAHHISHAVDVYIDHKTTEIVCLQDDQELEEQVRGQLHQKSDGTFLWVALVIEELQDVLGGDILEVLEEIPSGLTPLYDRMMKQIRQLRRQYPQYCFLTLSIATLAYRPLHLLEMHTVAGLQKDIRGLIDLKGIISMCGSFLTIRDNYIYFIHQSAKDYLTKNTYTTIFPDGPGHVHHHIFLRSLDALSTSLKRDIFQLNDPGPIRKNTRPDVDPLASIQYACVFWLDHFCEISAQSLFDKNDAVDDGSIFAFFKQHFLHWLESLSLIGKLSEGVLAVSKLLDRVQYKFPTSPRLARFLEDAERFVLSYRPTIEQAPLQTYGAALAFSPTMSVVKNLYWKERLPFIKNITGIREDWDPCRQTLEGHSDWVYAVAFSPDGTALASASGDRDVATGAARQTLEGHSEWVNAAAFSPDGTALASASYDDTVRLWDVATGVGTQTFDIKIAVTKLSFSEDGGYLKTDRGILNLNPDSPAICLQKVLTSAILVETEWVTRDGQNLLWLPPDYRATCCAVYNNKLVLGHASGMVTHLEFVSS